MAQAYPTSVSRTRKASTTSFRAGASLGPTTATNFRVVGRFPNQHWQYPRRQPSLPDPGPRVGHNQMFAPGPHTLFNPLGRVPQLKSEQIKLPQPWELPPEGQPPGFDPHTKILSQEFGLEEALPELGDPLIGGRWLGIAGHLVGMGLSLLVVAAILRELDRRRRYAAPTRPAYPGFSMLASCPKGSQPVGFGNPYPDTLKPFPSGAATQTDINNTTGCQVSSTVLPQPPLGNTQTFSVFLPVNGAQSRRVELWTRHANTGTVSTKVHHPSIALPADAAVPDRRRLADGILAGLGAVEAGRSLGTISAWAQAIADAIKTGEGTHENDITLGAGSLADVRANDLVGSGVGEVPGVLVDVATGVPVDVVVDPIRGSAFARANTHVYATPNRSYREAKLKIPYALIHFLAVFTLGKGWVRDIWKALPKRDRTRGRPLLSQMLNDIFEHLGDVNWDQAAADMLLTGIKYGIEGSLLRKVNSGTAGMWSDAYVGLGAAARVYRANPTVDPFSGLTAVRNWIDKQVNRPDLPNVYKRGLSKRQMRPRGRNLPQVTGG